MKNVTELTTQLAELFADLKTGVVDVKVASEMNNTAGKIINAQKVLLEYAALTKTTPDVPFLK
jgi:hypothetical protein